MKKEESRNIEFITFNGFYRRGDEDDTLHKHSEGTYSLYCQGLKTGPEAIGDEDVFNGVCFDTDGTPIAEWRIDGSEKYFTIE